MSDLEGGDWAGEDPSEGLGAFREAAQRWLEDNAPARGGPDDFDIGREQPFVDGCRRWQRQLYDAGWAGLSWPVEYGGRGLPAAYDLAFRRLQSQFGVSTAALDVGLGMVAPTLMVHGSDAQRVSHLPALLQGGEVWCQMFSEPSAGSDLASISTSAKQAGRGWVVEGRKVWTSYARFADFAVLLARTDPERPRHRGLSLFIVDMRSPGIEISPIRQMNGAAEFNEIALDGVEIPDDAVVGKVNDGWAVARTLLGSERGLVGTDWIGTSELISTARRMGVSSDPVVRQRIVEVYIGAELLRFLDQRVQDQICRGINVGALGSIVNLSLAAHLRRATDAAAALLGPAMVATPPGDEVAARWAFELLTAPSVRIASGTDEIQRNVLAEQALGLPRDPRPRSLEGA